MQMAGPAGSDFGANRQYLVEELFERFFADDYASIYETMYSMQAVAVEWDRKGTVCTAMVRLWMSRNVRGEI